MNENHYKIALIELLDLLSDKAVKRICQLAEYFYIYKEDDAK